MFAFVFDESLFEFAYDTPPFAFALLYDRQTTRPYGGFRLSRYKNIKFVTKKPNFVISKIFSSGLRHFQYPASVDAG